MINPFGDMEESGEPQELKNVLEQPPDGHLKSPTCGHFKIPHLTAQIAQ